MKRTILAALLAACGTDDPAPTAEVLAVTPTELAPADDAADDLRIRVRYEDADGDLGTGIARIHDCRAEELVTELAIPAIAAMEHVDEGRTIAGTLELDITDVGAAAPATLTAACAELDVGRLDADETVFCVVLVDAEGNAGSGDCTPSIRLL